MTYFFTCVLLMLNEWKSQVICLKKKVVIDTGVEILRRPKQTRPKQTKRNGKKKSSKPLRMKVRKFRK